MSIIQTTCPYCGVGCGVIATVTNNKLTVEGDKSHPANFGRLCSKGAALAETVDLDNRLLYPELHGQRSDWDTALNYVATQLQQVIATYGADAVAFYVSGQLLTEDYYVANKLMKGFIGEANIDTNSRLCMSSSVAGQQRAFGSDTVPGNYEDLELADLLVLVGTNLAWCHPVLFQRISAAKQQRRTMKVVVIDPYRTATCDIADSHLAIKPGTDVWLFNGLLNYLRVDDQLDFNFLENSTQGFAEALYVARESAPSVPMVAQTCGLSESQVADFYRLFARKEKVVTLYSQGVNQSSCGTDKVNSIINCHLASGRIGKPGSGPFSVTGQPNAMGGREVGGLANQLAAHMSFTPETLALVQEFWQSPRIATRAGLKAVDMFAAVGRGEIKAIWIMGTNPLVSMPYTDSVKQALQNCELVIVSDCVRHNDTTTYAHVLLPAQAWGEKEGTVTNSERRISRQRAFLTPPGETQPDWWIISQVAQRLGYKAHFNYYQAADVFREHAALSGYKNQGTRDFDLSGLSQLSDKDYQNLQPQQWPVYQLNVGTPRLFTDGRFYTPNQKARLIPLVPRRSSHLPDAKYPLILNTGRIRDQWHTMTRTGKTARLLAHISEPYLEIHPRDAKSVGVREGALVQVSSCLGQVWVRAKVAEEQQVGCVFMPIHWNNQTASRAKVNTLISPITDPISGQPAFKQTPVKVEPLYLGWHGFVLSRQAIEKMPEEADYSVKIRSDECWRYELAGFTCPPQWSIWVRDCFGSHLEWVEYHDRATGRYRSASIVDGRLHTCVFIAPNEQLPSRSSLISLFAKDSVTPTERLSLLTGQPIQGQSDKGRVVCSCFNVGRNTLVNTIRQKNLRTAQAIGTALQAGTNCGSCIPELKALIQEVLGITS